jgi:hypothetical protein
VQIITKIANNKKYSIKTCKNVQERARTCIDENIICIFALTKVESSKSHDTIGDCALQRIKSGSPNARRGLAKG